MQGHACVKEVLDWHQASHTPGPLTWRMLMAFLRLSAHANTGCPLLNLMVKSTDNPSNLGVLKSESQKPPLALMPGGTHAVQHSTLLEKRGTLPSAQSRIRGYALEKPHLES